MTTPALAKAETGMSIYNSVHISLQLLPGRNRLFKNLLDFANDKHLREGQKGFFFL